jgi:hypothetical protein
MDERVDDPVTATSAPPPVVPVDPTVAATPTPFVLPSTEEPSLNAILFRFFGIFLLAAVVTALLVTLVGMQFLPEKSTPPLVLTTGPVETVVVPAPAVVADPDTEPDSDTDELSPNVEPMVTPQPAAVTVSEPVPVTAPVPVVVVPEPVVEDTDTDTEAVEVVEPTPVPEPVVSRVPEAAQALTGT